MAVSVSTAGGALATVALAQANAAKNQAREAGCVAIMRGFEDSNATDEAKREYASCVGLLVPEPYSPPTLQEKIEVGGVVAFLLISALVGAFVMCRHPSNRSLLDVCGGVVFGLFGGGMLLLAAEGVFKFCGFMTA